MNFSTHIKGFLRWSESVFCGYKINEDQIIIFLNDGTDRRMNLSWGADSLTTLTKVQNLRQGDRFFYATWTSYDIEKWFCDVAKG